MKKVWELQVGTRTTTENEKMHIKGFLVLWCFISLYLKWLTQPILCFLSLQWLVRGVVVNKFHIKWTSRRVLCFHHFFSRRGYNGSKCYTYRLFRMVVLHMSMWCYYWELWWYNIIKYCICPLYYIVNRDQSFLHKRLKSYQLSIRFIQLAGLRI